MRTREVISKVKNYKDQFDFDIAEASGLKTKKDCLEALQAHKQWLEDAGNDALRDIDSFIEELGIEYE